MLRSPNYSNSPSHFSKEVSNFIDLVIHKNTFQPGEAKVAVITANGDVVAKLGL